MRVKEYITLAKKILEGREKGTLSEQDEDLILDKMDFLWFRMTEEEMCYINSIEF